MKATHCLLRLLGQPRLSWLGEPARDIRFRYRKTWLLLACLACHPAEWQPRSVLAGRLWPALPAAAALTNLRQLLADASQGLGSLALGLALEVERQQVRLRPHAQLLVDLHLLREWQQQAPADAELSLAALGDAQIWLSPLLEGFSTDALTSGEDWLGPERQRWRQTGLASVRTLSRWLQAQGRTAAAISAARAAWQQEPLDEDLAAGLIDLLVAHADLRGAREVLTLTDNHWRSELGLAAPAALRARLPAPGVSPPPPARPATEQRWLTLLQLQFSPSAQDAANAPPDEFEAACVQALSQAQGLVRQWGGEPLAVLGRSATACFGAGPDPEHAAERAVLAALAVRAASAPSLICCGAVVSGFTLVASGPQGLALPERLPLACQALCEEAADSSLLVCADVAAQISQRFVLQAHALPPPAGACGPVARVLGLRPPTSAASPSQQAAGDAPDRPVSVLGREREVRQLQQAWARAQGGEPQWLVLVGPAGIGKTTLAEHLAQTVTAQGGQMVRWPCSLRLQARPFGPLRRHLALKDDATPNRPQLLDAAFDWLDRTSRTEPLLLLLDDVHWADEATREFLARYAATFANQRLMLLCTSRPEAPLPEEGRPPQLLPLGPLAAADTRALIRRHAGADLLDPVQLDEMAQRSGGIPLFAERLALQHAGGSAAPPGVALPYMLQAELDRLGRGRQVLQAAAVLGPQFSATALAALLPDEPDLAPVLAQALALQLLIPAEARGEQGYAFRHGLIHEAAKNSLPRATRRELHGRQLALLHMQPSTPPAELASHLEGAERWAEARDRWAEAGDTALTQEFAQDAMRHYARALQLGEQPGAAPPQNLLLHLRLQHAQATMMCQGYGSPLAHATYGEVLQALQSSDGDTAERRRLRFRALSGLYMGAGSQGRSLGLAHARGLVNTAQDPAEMLMACFAMGNSQFWHGELADALHHLQRAAELASGLSPEQRRRCMEDDAALLSASVRSWNLWFLGRPEEARQLADATVGLARQAGRAHALCFSLSLAAAVHWCLGDTERVLAVSGEACMLSERFGFPLWRGLNRLFVLWARACQGAPGVAAEGLQAAQQMRMAYRAGSTTARWILGSALLQAGETQAAQAELTLALEDARSGLDHFCEPELLRLLALCQLKSGETQAAECLLMEAEPLAVRLGATGLLPAVRELQRAARRQGASLAR